MWHGDLEGTALNAGAILLLLGLTCSATFAELQPRQGSLCCTWMLPHTMAVPGLA